MDRFARYVVQFFTLVATLASSQLDAAKLHAMLVADIHDQSIGLSCRQDSFQWMWEFQRIEQYTDLEVETHLIVDRDFSADNVLAEIEKLEVGPDDAIVFTYSGHGYRNESKETKWPVMFVGPKETCLDEKTVIDAIAEKRPRFALVLCDCCNAIYPDSAAPTYRTVAMRGRKIDHTLENYARLFVESAGLLAISASDIGEYAYGYTNGGLYSVNFLKELRKSTKTSRSLTWDDILTKTYERVVHKQTPIHEYFELEAQEEVIVEESGEDLDPDNGPEGVV